MQYLALFQYHLGAGFKPLHHLFKRAGFGDLDAAKQTVDRFAQRAAKQRMIVGDQDTMRLLLAQSFALSLPAQDPQNCRSTSRRCGVLRCSAT